MNEEVTEFGEGEEDIFEVKEVKPESTIGVDSTDNLIDEEFEEMLEGEKQPSQVSRELIQSISKRHIEAKILKFLYKNRRQSFYLRQIFNHLGIDEQTLIHHLRKLVKAGILRKETPFAIDKRLKYYRIVDIDAVEKIIKRYHWLVSFELARELRLDRTISLNELKKKTKFPTICRKYELTHDEAIEALKLNTRKVECVFSDYPKRQLIGFRRKEQ